MDKELPPPVNIHTNYSNSELPDYYLGMLIYYDDLTEDSCKWVVYDGYKKVRCVSRRSALDYIQTAHLNTDEETAALLTDARISLQRALDALERAGRTGGDRKLQYEYMAVKLRPYIVELDNVILPLYETKRTYGKRKGMPAC